MVILLHALVAAAPIVPALMIQYLVLQHRLPWVRGTQVSIVVALIILIAMFATVRTRYGLRMLRSSP